MPALSRVRTGMHWFVALGCAIPLIGCSAQPPVAPVRGTVTYEGKPLPTGTVLFIPDFTGQYATGTIKPDGTYVLTTFKEGDGALVGSHKIMVNAISFSGPGGAGVPLVPMEYLSEQMSGLNAVVVADQENVVDLVLEAKPKKSR